MPPTPPDPHFSLNGQRWPLVDGQPTESLLRWLRRQGLHGTKEGCADGDCGACTVLLVQPEAPPQRRLQAVNSCLLPLGQLLGRELYTVESVARMSHADPAADADAQLHPVQQAMVRQGGSQCGYCTPGFVISLLAGLHAGELDDHCFEGNLCRCTGYRPIRAAAAELAALGPVDDAFARRCRQPASPLPAASWGAFHNPTTVGDALALKAAQPQAQWIAGATDLGVGLSQHRPSAPAYIALDRIAELQQLRIEDDAIRIGAAVPLRRLEQELAEHCPPITQMLAWFAARQVRQRATLGGNLGSASPIGDLLPVLLALEAVVESQGPTGARQIPIDAFFLGYRQTALAADELITRVSLPRRDGLICASLKLAKRPSDDISIVAACFALLLDQDRRVTHVRLAYGGVAATPVRAQAAEAMLLGQILDEHNAAAALAALPTAFTTIDDHRASADYRRRLCAGLFARFLAEHCGLSAALGAGA